MTRCALLAALSIVLLPSPALSAPKGWWDRDYSHRKRVVLAERQRWEGAPAAHIRLATGGRAKPDGSDIRVIADGNRVVPCAVVARGPGDFFEVAFPVGSRSEWDIYYGNPDAAPPKEPFVPDRGLVLETRARGAGTPDDWKGMERILEGSSVIYGGAYWPRVFDAENPFGPSDDYVSIYRGHIQIPADGAYTFFTASDEASFLFVDGKLVAQWPGWHQAGAGAWGRYKGSIQLTAGLHPFRYVHVERAGAQAMAAYWQPPGADKGRVIPETAFPGLLTAQVLCTEAYGKDVTADFVAAPAEKWGVEDRVFANVILKARLAGPEAEYRWDFGDGVAGSGPIANHVYLAGGAYDVALTVMGDGDRDTVIRTIHVSNEWTRFDRNRPEALTRFARIAATYPGERLDAASLSMLVFLLTEAEMQDALAVQLKAAVGAGRMLRDDKRHAFAFLLGVHHRDRSRDLAEALWAFRTAAAVKNPQLQARAQIHLADAFLELGGDVQVARKMLDKLTADPDVKGDDARLAWIRLGDAHMSLGEGKPALQCYRKAQELAGGPEDSRRILRKVGAMRSAMTMIGTGELTRVLEQLREWEMQGPTDRFTGLHRITKAKALALRGEPGLATRELEALVAGNPESEYADQALALLAEVATASGDEAAAAAWLEKLRTDYPWSPLAR